MIFGKINYKSEIFDVFIQNDKVFLLQGSFYFDYKIIDSIDIKSANFINPINPTKIVGVGLNYKNHAKELNFGIPENPIVFLKPLNTLCYNGEKIFYPQIVERLDYEAELAIIIKKTAKNIKKREAYDYILGYSCANDITARCIQKKDGQWTRAKGFDNFCPVGPLITTDIDPNNLGISLYLNDELKQKNNTSDMIFDIPFILEFITSFMPLEMGDVILTGTPEGIGPMKKGDKVRIEIEKIGVLENEII